MIRPAISDDKNSIMTLAKAIGFFQAHEINQIENILDDYFEGNENDIDSDYCWVVVEVEGLVIGVAYYGMEAMTNQTWNLYFIAVQPEYQRQGYGRRLLGYVEVCLMKRGGRLLLVETSGLPEFNSTWAFYSQCGFEEEGRIRDFYKAGEDKIIFRKVLGNIGDGF